MLKTAINKNHLQKILIIAICIFLLFFWITDKWLKKVLTDNKKQEYLSSVQQHGNSLDQAVSERFALLNGLYAFTHSTNSKSQLNEHFESFTAGLHIASEGIRNFALAPNGVQRYVYPLKGNEKVLGHDLINDKRPNVRKDVHRAMETRQIILSGPYNLRQGGLGLVARKALYVENNFWGLVTMVIDLPPVLEEAALHNPQFDIEFALRKDDGRVFYGDKQIFENHPVMVSIKLPDGQWELAAIPTAGWDKSIQEPLLKLRLLGILIITLIAALIYLIYSRQFFLKSEVLLRTSELKERNELLNDEINDRKRAEVSLQRSNSLLTSIIESPDNVIMFSLDRNYDYLSFNQAHVKEMKRVYYADIEIGQNISSYIPREDDRMKSEENYKRVLKGERFIEIQEYGEAGSRFWYELIFNPIFDDLRHVTGFTVFVTEITDRKKAEGELIKAHKLESIGLLAGGIAHDFNNILAGILNNIYLSKMHIDRESKEYNYLESAEKAISRATNLTGQLLTFARGGSPIKKTASIISIIEESAEFVLKGSNVKCEYITADNLWAVEVDEGQINQVIHNIILNANQAMPEGGKIRIVTENITLATNTGLPLKEGRYLKVTVQDKGTGISEEHLKNIFDPYFTTKEAGRGLGLSITYSIINQHDGLITAKSNLGAGTTFTIYLPASEKQVEENKSVECTAIPGDGKVLIMDDEEVFGKSVVEFLSIKGYTVEYAEDGGKAIELYKKAQEGPQPFDAVILDLTIRGGMGGKTVIKKLLEIDSDVKAIVSSGYSNDPVMANFIEYGFSGIFNKASDGPDDLCRILNEVIEE